MSTSQMNDELGRLLVKLVDEQLDRTEMLRLSDILRGNPKAQARYHAFITLHGLMLWQSAPPHAIASLPVASGQWPVVSGQQVADDSFNREPAGSVTTGGLSQFSSDENGTVPLMPDATPSPYLGFLGSAYNGVTGYFSTHDVARALLIVTLIFAPIVGFAVYALLQPDQQVAKAPKPEPLGPALFPHEGARAGAITGTLDCVWKDSQLRFPESDVCVGDVLRIDAGLMEITYDSGAKVILQAPTTYTVTSKTGGYLDIGRLTAKMGVKPKAWQKSRFGVPEAGNEELGTNNEERRTNKEERPAPASPSRPSTLDSPLFAVTTPSAVVTDLGTEFGVHVDKHGATESLVFVGTVKVQTPAAEGEKPAREETLYASDSARVEQKGQGDTATYTVQRNIVKPDKFVRVLRRAAKPEPVAESPVDDEKQHRFASGAIFEQMPPGRYYNADGAAVYDRSDTITGPTRAYLRTIETDYCDRDFVFEGTFHVSLDRPDKTNWNHIIFFGIGDGVPNAQFYDEPTAGLALTYQVDQGRAFVQMCDPNFLKGHGNQKVAAEMAPRGGLRWGWHRFRIVKIGKTLTFSIGPEKPSIYEKTYESPPIDLAAATPWLNATNSRLMLGTGNCELMSVRFETLSATTPSTPPESGAGAKEDEGAKEKEAGTGN